MKQDKNKEAFSKNWHHVRKAGGPLWSGWEKIDATDFAGGVNLDIYLRRNALKEMIVLFDMRIDGCKGYQSLITRCAAGAGPIVSHLKHLQKSAVPIDNKKAIPKNWTVAAGRVLDRAVSEFAALEIKPASILTVRASGQTADKIKLAGDRCGLRVSSKILLFCLDYFLLATESNEDQQPAPADGV